MNTRILKLQGWEMKFLSRIVELRNSEGEWLKKYMYARAIATSVFWGGPTFVAVVTFSTCMLIGILLKLGKILSSLAKFRILQEPIYSLPDTISMIARTKVSLDRISSFLCLDEIESDIVEKLLRGSSHNAIEIIDGTFSWDVSSPIPTLKDINVNVFHGMKVAVCGTVGSGKSSLLSCTLGEVSKISGSIKLAGTKACVYSHRGFRVERWISCLALRWIERGTRRFLKHALKKDLEILSFGDQPVIGERGINLSGGQKERVQIARALYQDADIICLMIQLVLLMLIPEAISSRRA